MSLKMSKEYFKDYYLKNREKKLKYQKQYYLKNKKKIDKYRKEYSIKNKDKEDNWKEKWREENYQKYLENGRLQSQNRRNPKLGKLTKKIIKNVYNNNIEKFKRLKCIICNKFIYKNQWSLEHKTPICRGGTHNINNLGISHLKCNQRKARKTIK